MKEANYSVPQRQSFSEMEVSIYYRHLMPQLKQEGAEWRGVCPVHPGANGLNFTVNAKTGQAKCHSKCPGDGWNITKLEADLYHNGDTREAYKKVCEIIWPSAEREEIEEQVSE